MKKRLLRGLAVSMAAVLCLMLLVSCGQSKQNWNGTFYMEIDNGTYAVFDIMTFGDEAEVGDSLRILRAEYQVDENGGYVLTSANEDGTLTKANTVEGTFYSYTLDGDILTVKSVDGEDFTLVYEGAYTRGEPLPNSDDGEDYYDDDYDFVYDSLNGFYFNKDYVLDGDADELTLYFYEDGSVLLSDPDQSAFGEYTADNKIITIVVEGDVLELEVLDSETLVTEDGEAFIMMD